MTLCTMSPLRFAQLSLKPCGVQRCTRVGALCGLVWAQSVKLSRLTWTVSSPSWKIAACGVKRVVQAVCSTSAGRSCSSQRPEITRMAKFLRCVSGGLLAGPWGDGVLPEMLR